VYKEDDIAPADVLLERQVQILVALADGGRPLHETLEDIACLVEEQEPDALCSVLLIEGNPPQIVDAAGLEQSAALDPSLHWRSSVPVTADGQVVATLEITSRAAGKTVAVSPTVVHIATGLAAIAISRHHDMRDRRDAEVRFRGLVERMPFVTYVGSADGSRVLYLSPQVEAMFGFSADGVIGSNTAEAWFTRVHPDDQERTYTEWRRAVAEQRGRTAEYRLQRGDGTWAWVRSVDSVIRDEAGFPTARQGAVFDITAEVESAQALREAENLYRSLVEQLPAIIYLDTGDETVSYTSPQIEALVGMTAEEWAIRWQETIHPDDRDWVTELYLFHRAQRTGYQADYRMLGADGRTIWISEHSVPVLDEQGVPKAIQGVILDVTERTLAQESLRESERRFRELLETVHLAAVITDVDGTVTFCNEYFCHLSGYSMDEIIGRNWIELFVPADAEAPEAEFYANLERGDVTSFMTGTVRTRDGDRRAFTWSNTALRGPDGTVVAAASLGEDVTDRLRAESSLRVSEERRRTVLAEMVLTAEEERTRIATELHDDTVQVMTAALLSLDRLSSAISDGDRERMASTVALSRETLGKAVDRTRRLMFELRPPVLEAQGLEPALVDLAETAGAEAGFEVDTAIHVGRYPEAVEALAYRVALEAIVNARKHSRASMLSLRLAERDGMLVGEVHDDGAGFDVQPALDRRGMRFHMGLDTMIERVRLAGGDVTVESALGRGTTVSFRIPAA
jgi:PAS domain S-box-containing protein